MTNELFYEIWMRLIVKKCALGSCNKRVLERLEREWLRDGGSP
jgi:hypothetical protein